MEHAHEPRHPVADGAACRVRIPPRVPEGRPLPGPVRRPMERLFGCDLTGVRIHTDDASAAAADRLAAAAYSVGDDIAFADGRYRPDTSDGRRLLVHELTHVVQNAHTPAGAVPLLSDAADPAERRAAAVTDPSTAPVASGGPSALIHRAPQTWYRGEGLGVPAAVPGAALHDLGEGLYLTDNAAVAGEYAALRAGASPELARTLTATLDPRILGRVLDLTTDARWAAYLRSSPVPGGATVEHMIKMANENYSRFFEQFLRSNNIRIADFDAIKAQEFVRGGTQLCIRNPQVQAQVRAVLRAVPAEAAAVTGSVAESTAMAESTAVAESTAIGEVVTAGRVLGTGVGRAAVAAAVARRVGVGLLRGLILAIPLLGLEYLKHKREKEQFEHQLRDIEPKVVAKIGALLPRATALQRTAGGRTVWTTATIEIRNRMTVMSSPYGGVGSYEAFDGVDLAGVTVGLQYSDLRHTTVNSEGTMIGSVGSATGFVYTERVSISTPVPYDVGSLDESQLRARWEHNEQDAARPNLPQAALDVLFDERDEVLDALQQRATDQTSPLPDAP